MQNYLGETVVPIRDSKFKDFTKEDWVMLWVEMYSGIDGAHHKVWLIDQIARILKGVKVEYKVVRWQQGDTVITEDRLNLLEPTDEYVDWVEGMMCGDDGEFVYSYDVGIAP